jgi:hypothetical protein
MESINLLKPKPKREIEKKEKVGWVVRHTTLPRGGEAKFAAMTVPRQCPLVLLVKVIWIGGKTFGS